MVRFWVPCILGAVFIIGIQKGTIILTTTHIVIMLADQRITWATVRILPRDMADALAFPVG